MARHEHLPIYKAALNLRVRFEKLVAGFSCYHKYTLGTELRDGSRAALQQVLRANNASTRDRRAAELLVLRERPLCSGTTGGSWPGRAGVRPW